MPTQPVCQPGSVLISQLAAASGVPVGTIKYYLREGLLPPGKRTAPRLSEYSGVHLYRLRLIRALREIAELPIDALRDITAALDAGDEPSDVVQYLSDAGEPHPGDDAAVSAIVRMLVNLGGWTSCPHGAATSALAEVVRFTSGEDGLAPLEREALVACVKAADSVVKATLSPGASAERTLIHHVLAVRLVSALADVALQHHCREAEDAPDVETSASSSATSTPNATPASLTSSRRPGVGTQRAKTPGSAKSPSRSVR